LSNPEDRVDVRGDGRIILYKREGLKNPKWQARIHVPNSSGYKIVSTKTGDVREAERFALDLYEEVYIHVKSGGSIKSRTFRQVFEEWEKVVTTIGPTRQGGSWDSTIERVRSYALEFFGPKKIDDIGPHDFSDFWVWRKSHYSRRPPSNPTLRRERTSLLPVFKFAVSRGYISEVPETEAPRARAERRPTFTLDEWRTIARRAREWVKEGEAKATWRDRYVAQQYFLILANTGMRVGELRQLRWSDLRTVQTENGSRLIGYVNGKTGRREVVFQEGAEEYVKRLYDLRCDELKKIDADKDQPRPDKNGLVVCHKDGTPIQTLTRSFQSLLDFAEVPTTRDGMERTIYSLRHFYATQRLSHDTSPFLLAKQMGTSVEMLEKFYGQTVTSALAAQISKSKQRATKKGDADYPFE
jgi:integrase